MPPITLNADPVVPGSVPDFVPVQCSISDSVHVQDSISDYVPVQGSLPLAGSVPLAGSLAGSSKSAISAWWILALLSLFLWYRNERGIDRALAVFVFTLGIFQLIEYGIQSGADPAQSGRALFITLWLQCLVLAIGVWIFIHDTNERTTLTQNIIHTIAGWNLILFGIVFVVVLVVTFTHSAEFRATPEAWTVQNRPAMDRWGWLYAIGIFVPLILLFGYYMWADIAMATLIIYSGLAAALFLYHSGSGSRVVWSYISVGFACLAWCVGIPTITNKPEIS